MPENSRYNTANKQFAPPALPEGLPRFRGFSSSAFADVKIVRLTLPLHNRIIIKNMCLLLKSVRHAFRALSPNYKMEKENDYAAG